MCQQLNSVRKEIVQFRSGPFELVAFWDLPRGDGPFPAVLLCHGFTGHHVENRRLFSRLARILGQCGIAVMRFDHRGCGDSSGDFGDFTPDGLIEDLESAERQFFSHPEVHKSALAVVGYSLGGVSAAYLAVRHPELRTVVLWAPVAHPEIIQARFSEASRFEGSGQQGFIDWGGWRVSYEYIDRIAERVSPLAWLTAYAGPVLCVHGSQDEIVPLTHSESFLSARQQRGDSLFVIQGADHAFSNCEAIDSLLSRTQSWIVEKLLLKLD